MNYCIETIPQFMVCMPGLPASKSISNRALMVNALSGRRCQLSNWARCDDTNVMITALITDKDEVNVGAAGTAMRFLTAYFSLQQGREVVLDGTERMRQRPISPLVDALNACGADIRYLSNKGYPPLAIHGRSYHCEQVVIDAAMSSQFISAVLMIAPVIGCKRVELKGNIISRPYIDMTLGIMRSFGVQSAFEGNVIHIDGTYNPLREFAIECDWSAASYWFEIQALGGEMTHVALLGLSDDSLQGDKRVCNIFRQYLGVDSKMSGTVTHLIYTGIDEPRFMEIDMADCPDLAQTVVVTACLKGVPFHITGLQTLRIKETDRIEALRSQLAKLGYTITVDDDCSLSYDGSPSVCQWSNVIDTFNDHRMAMAFAPAAMVHPGLVIADAGVVSKSYPSFWEHLAIYGFGIKEVEI